MIPTVALTIYYLPDYLPDYLLDYLPHGDQLLELVIRDSQLNRKCVVEVLKSVSSIIIPVCEETDEEGKPHPIIVSG